MVQVLYFLGFLSILLGAAVGADRFVDEYSLGLSLSVAYQTVIGGVLLFVMARLLQYAAATALNTEKFYQHSLHGSDTMMDAAAADATQVKTAPEIKSKAAGKTATEDDAKTASKPTKKGTKSKEKAPEEAPEVVEQIELRGYTIDKLSDGKVTVYTAEGPMQFESLDVFIHELKLSNE